jgi:glycosyltransferase involved in cell wall biosynthesis
MPRILKSADCLFVLSRGHALGSLLRPLVEKNLVRSEVVPNGVDLSLFDYRLEKREIANIDKNKDLVIGFVGGLDSAHYFKGVDLLIRAFARIAGVTEGTTVGTTLELSLRLSVQCRDLKLMIVGEGNLKNKYEKLAEELGIRDQVIFAGGIAQKDLPRYYKAMDIFVLPSIDTESFGIVLTEAMAMKVPVIASRLAGVDETFHDGEEGLFFEPRKIEELTDKLRILIADGELRKGMGEKGLKLVSEKYQWESVAGRVEEIYREIVKN